MTKTVQRIASHGKNNKNARILHAICQKKYLFPDFFFLGGGNSRLYAASEWTRPQHQGGHRFTDAIVLNKLFMGLLTLLYSISLDE